jgi:serine protease AprX
MLAVNTNADTKNSSESIQVEKSVKKTQNPQVNLKLSQYLWDEEEVPQDDEADYDEREESIARYLWEGDGYRSLPHPLPRPPKDGKLASYLWDDEIGSGYHLDPEIGIASYLWDDELGGGILPTLDVSMLNTPQSTSTYRWKDSETYQQIASISPNFRVEAKTKRFIAVAHDLDKLRVQLQQRKIIVLEEFGIIKSIGVQMTRAQFRSLKSEKNIISIVEDGEVQTASLQLSAKGDGELSIDKNKVSWTIHNLGKKTIVLDELELSWPTENGSLKKITVNERHVFGRSGNRDQLNRDNSENVLEIGSALIKIGKVKIENDKSATITLVFEKVAAELQENYLITAAFSQGLTVEYAYHSSLPNQGRRRDTFYPTLIDADMLHVQGVTGNGVGIAVIDTGSWNRRSLTKNTRGEPRISAYYDAIENRTTLDMTDENGHGSHIASVIASSKKTLDLNGSVPGSYHGIAPDSDLVIVRAFDDEGRGTYMNVVRAIAYVIAHKEEHNIKVLNLSFGATPGTHYWQDPINLAVMAAWRAGIVVIVSAGNKGPDPMSIGVPGNVPYVVTVGAMTDHYTPDDLSDDYLATFSSAGPTVEGFVKPEITAPGGHMMGIMSLNSFIAQEHPEFHDGFTYFLMSGTSQAAAVASGVAALMLQEDPDLTPNDIKCRLMSSARAATKPDGSLAYSLFQQGTGLVNAWDAVHSTASDCVNIGLDIDKDLAGVEHYGGPANRDADGNFVLTTTEGYIWNLSSADSQGYIWNLNDLSNLGYIWNLGYVWDTSTLEENGYIWNLSDFENNGYIWNLAQLEQDGYIWNLSNPQSTGAPPQQSEGYIWNLSEADSEGYIWNLRNSESEGYIWNLGNIENANFVWNMAFTETGGYVWNMGYIWNLNDPENAGYIWNLGDTQNQGYIWNLNNPEGAGYIWNLADAENEGYIWNLNEAENEGYIWNLADAENEGYIWNLNEAENEGYIWNLADAENEGYIWNLADAENEGYIWNLNDAENKGYIWNLADADNEGYIWNLNDAENEGYIWNLNDAENEGYIWNLSNAQNEGYIWNLNDAQNEGYIWNLNDAENEGYIWNLNDADNQGYIWNLSSAESNGYIWNLSAAQNAGYIWNLNNPENDGYIWNLNGAENDGYIWNLNSPDNTGYIWNLSGSVNNGYIWNLAGAQNEGYIWNLNNAENEGYIWNLSSMSVNKWVAQE